MAVLKESNRDIFTDWRTRQEQLDIDSPVLKTRYRVSEITPAYDDNDGFYHSAETKGSWRFDTKEEADRFIERYDPDKNYYVDNIFTLTEEYLREFHEKRWVTY